MKHIKECADCLEPFCATCEDDAGKCPECKMNLCSDCFWEAAQDRQNRCRNCSDPELGVLTYPYAKHERKLHKHYVTGHRGQMPCE